MAGVLTFTLGLETSNFLRGIGLASGQIISMSAAMDGLAATMRGVWGAIERGDQLQDLSNRTGESVRDLYTLQEAFKMVGLSSEEVAPMIGKLQNALGGIDATSQRTAKFFHAAGVDLNMIRSLDAPQQFEAIAGALARMDKNQAASLATKLFGDDKAGSFLQLSRDFGDFADALKSAGPAAEIFARMSRTFAAIGKSLAEIRQNVNTMFAGIAEGAAPAILALTNLAAGFDFKRIGAEIGNVLTAITQAFREGGVGDLIGVSIRNGIAAGLVGLGGVILKAFEEPMVQIQAGMEYALTNGAKQFADNPAFRAILSAMSPGGAALLQSIGAGGATWEETLASAREKGVRFNLGSGEFGIADIFASAGDQFKPLMEKIQGLLYRGDPITRSDIGLQDEDEAKAKRQKRASAPSVINATSLEEMGFMFGSGFGPSSDYARTTADSTRELVTLSKAANKFLAKLNVSFKAI